MPVSETVVKNLPGGVDQPFVRFIPQKTQIARPQMVPISIKNPPIKTLFIAFFLSFYSIISSLSSGSVNGTVFGSVWYQYATDV